jgi:hypothetical protein
MSNVRSEPLRSASAVPAGAGCIARLGVLFLLISVGPLIVFLNGGYSILGMAYLADKIGPYGRLFWSTATYFTVNVPIAQRAGLPLAQPVLPWMMVAGITFLEVSLILYRLRKINAGLWLNGAGLVVGAFDYITTTAGVAFALPITGILWYAWAVLAIIIAAPLTFSFEGLLAKALKGR